MSLLRRRMMMQQTEEGNVLLDAELNYTENEVLMCIDGTEFVFYSEKSFYLSDVLVYPSKIVLTIKNESGVKSVLFGGYLNPTNASIDGQWECWVNNKREVTFRFNNIRYPPVYGSYKISSDISTIVFDRGKMYVNDEFITEYDGQIQICQIGGRIYATNNNKVLKHITLYK